MVSGMVSPVAERDPAGAKAEDLRPELEAAVAAAQARAGEWEARAAQAGPLSEATARIEALEEQVRGLRESRNAALTEARELEAQFIARLDSASKRLLGLVQDIDG